MLRGARPAAQVFTSMKLEGRFKSYKNVLVLIAHKVYSSNEKINAFIEEPLITIKRKR